MLCDGMLQACLVNLVEGSSDQCKGFINRLFCLLNWTLTEFTVSAQVKNLFFCSLSQDFWNCPRLARHHWCLSYVA